MAVHAVSYDLRKPGRNYQGLYDRLAAWNAFRVLQSVWIIKSDSKPIDICSDLIKYIDAGDGLMVGQLSNAAWYNLEGQTGDKLNRSF
jgi:hypothetical protein